MLCHHMVAIARHDAHRHIPLRATLELKVIVGRRARGNQPYSDVPIEKWPVNPRVDKGRDDFGVPFDFLKTGDKM